MASNVTEFFEMQEGKQPNRSEEIRENIEKSGSKVSSSAEFHHRLGTSTKLSGIDASEDKEKNENLRSKKELKKIQCIPSGHSANLDSLKNFLEENKRTCKQKMTISVLSDSECDNEMENILEVNETEPDKPVLSIRKKVCKSLVEAAALSNSWIITGGLNNGVHQLIENEVQQRLDDEDIVPTFLLEMSNRECLVKNLRNDSCSPDGQDFDSNTAGLWLNQNKNPISFPLVDDGVHECSLREKVEEALSKEQPLIYVLIGGGIKEIDYVKSVLTKNHYVIIAMRTGGATDVLSELWSCKDGAILEHLPEVVETLFKCLEEFLIGEGIVATVVEQVITKIKTESRLELLFEIVQLLDQKDICGEDAQLLKDEVASLGYTTTNELLAGIKDILTSKQTSSDNRIKPAADTEHNTANRIREIFEQMLVVTGIQRENAERAVNGLDDKIVKEALTTISLEAIRAHAQKHRLIKFDITGREKKTIFGLINEAPRNVSGLDGKSVECDKHQSNEAIKLRKTKFNRKKEDKDNVVTFIKRTFKKRECNRFRSETSQPEICICGYSKHSHTSEALENESKKVPSTKTFPTDAFGKLNCVEEEVDYLDLKEKSKDIRVIRLINILLSACRFRFCLAA